MLPRLSLLDELRKGGYESSLITTYNAYLPFYEEVVLRRLVNAGVRHNVLMMDAQQYAASITGHPPRLAGRNYTLLPLKVPGAFHPKLMFLAGKNKGLVFIGSHNMTLAGFGFNREFTNMVRIEGEQDAAGIALAQDVWREVEHWLAQFAQGVPDHVREMAKKVGDFAPWLTGAAVPGVDLSLLAGRPGAPLLWDQFRSLVGGPTSQVVIAGAFFDRRLGFLSRVKEELEPQSFAVAVDPRTVEIPAAARLMPGVSLVQGRQLGANEKEADSARYLHAKGIMVRRQDGTVVFASGSANPSTPAWLARDEAGNVELMIIRRGPDAEAAAQALGFAAIPDLPPLSDEDWAEIGSNSRREEEAPSPRHRTGLAVVDDDRVMFDAALVEGLEGLVFSLFTADGTKTAEQVGFSREGDVAVIRFKSSDLASAVSLQGMDAGELVLRLLLHHARAVEEQARTGSQRRFREALISLATDTPNIELLIQCIDKIVFAEHRAAVPEILRKTGKRAGEDAAEEEAPATLAIDVADMKNRKGKKRLAHSSDFAYLLDALIYHLNLQEDKSIEELDRFGRNEEEQVGADDDPDTDVAQSTKPDPDALLAVCHAKVNSVVNRMLNQLDAFTKGKQPLTDIMVRLLGVLAVLRELRHCDGRAAWVEKGKTAVPRAQRLRLLEGIILTLFERSRHEEDTSLLNLGPLGAEIEESDDVARLKGLILWLAWDCGLTLNLKKSFNEDRAGLQERLKRNAMVLALAQMIRADEIVIDEARQSIGSLTASELNWLTEIQQLAEQCTAVRADTAALQPAQRAEPGDIAVHRKLETWDLRVVASNGGDRLYLINLGKDTEPRAFKSDLLAVARLSIDGT